MNFLKVTIPKSKLDTMPKEEQVFLIQISRLLNELNVLNKCVIFSHGPTKPLSKAESNAQVFQALFFIRMLAGKLHEGWKVIQRDFLGKEYSRKYMEVFSQEGKDSLADLKRYFGRENVIYFIRNKFASHYDAEKIEEELNQVAQNEVLDIYISEHLGNCLYSFGEVMVNRAILKYINSSNLQQAMNRLVEEIAIKVNGWFQIIGRDCIQFIFKKLDHPDFTEIEVPEPPSINEVKLPYFVKK